jgi:hypothetical protein
MSTYVTTNVRLPAQMLKALKRRAVEENTSVAELIRASVTNYLLQQSARPVHFDGDPFFDLGKNAVEGPADAAEQHDRYIYADGKSQPQ